MKRILLPLACLLLSPYGWGQYRTGLYGTSVNDIATDGHTTSLSGQNGGLIVGLNSSAKDNFSITRTDVAGNSSGFFNKLFRVNDFSNRTVTVQEVHSVETGGTHYVIVGSYLNTFTSQFGIVYQRFSSTGSPLGAGIGYGASSVNYKNIHAQRVINSIAFPGDIYVVGYLDKASGGREIFILRLNSTGGVVWSKVYNTTANEIPMDVIESAQPGKSTNHYELVVVGAGYPSGNAVSDAFIMNIDATNGTMVNPVNYYGTKTTEEAFTCIKNAANTKIDASGAGFAVGGHTNLNGSHDFWFVAFNQSMSASWSNTYDYNNHGSIKNRETCSDILEHVDANGDFEYFLGGFTDNGRFDGEDMVVIRTDGAGNTNTNDQFTYGTKNSQRCIRLDMDDRANPGLRLFGYGISDPLLVPPMGNIDNYITNARFNGTADCPYDLQTADQKTGPGYTSQVSYKGSSIMSNRDMSVVFVSDRNQELLCRSCLPPLVAHWNFDNGGLTDNVNGLTATIVGGVTPTAGKLAVPNTAYLFDGTTGYMVVPSSPVLDLTSWTLTALVRPDGFYSGLCQVNAIIWRGAQFGPNHYDLNFFDNGYDNDCYISSPTKEVFAGEAAGSPGQPNSIWSPCSPNPCIVTGNWYCVWLSYNATTDIMALWVNGTLAVSFPWNGGSYGPPTVADLFIGHSDMFGAYEYFFKGAIDDIAIYGGALSPSCLLDCSKPENGQAKLELGITNPITVDDHITIHPNPATDIITVTTPESWYGGQLQLINAVGQIQKVVPVATNGVTQIDLTSLPASVYILKASNKSKMVIKKFIKQ